MANDLTGDFDVVAEFAIPAVNRVLAAMHRIERFPHSMSARVDDTPRPGVGGLVVDHPTALSIADVYGDPVTDHGSFGGTRPPILPGSGTSGPTSRFDGIVNVRDLGIHINPIVPSYLKGRAQLQLAPPTIQVTDATGTKLTVDIEVMSRYLPDPGTTAIPEYMRGSISITAPVNQVASQAGNIIDIGIRANNVVASFNHSYSSRPLSIEDIASINLLIGNSLKTSFLPSNAKLPGQIAHMQFKTMTGGSNAVAVLLDMAGSAGNPASAHNVFLQAADGFGFAVGAEYIKNAFQPTIQSILAQPIDPVKFKIDSVVHTWHITYTITLNSVTLDLLAGKMVLTIKGHAHTGTSWLPDFNFTVSQPLTLIVNGATAELGLGDISLDTSSSVVNLFKGGALNSMRKVRDKALADSNAQQTVRKMLSADENLGGFLKTLLSPAGANPPLPPLNFTLAYTSAEIRASGIILHGELSVPDSPQGRVEFEQISQTPQGPGGMTFPVGTIAEGPDYSALKSWIPGGTIRRFEWSRPGASQSDVDPNRFVLIRNGPVVAASAMSAAVSPGAAVSAGMSDVVENAHVMPAYMPMCLTIHGDRLSTGGAVASQPVTATVCGYSAFPVSGHFEILDGETAPLIALARKGAAGNVEVVGHTPALGDRSRRMSPNLVVHFASDESGDQTEAIAHSLREAGRADASTAIMVVMGEPEMTKSRFIDGITYSEDVDKWRQRFKANGKGASTVIVAPDGNVIWRSEGPIDTAAFASTLKKHLTRQSTVRVELLTARVRIGKAPPNFLFEHAPGMTITLRKMSGRPVVIVFCGNSLRPSANALRGAVSAAGASEGADPVVIAVHDVTTSRLAEKRDGETRGAIHVSDADGSISSAYGITMWPTIVSIDASGIVRSVSYGHITGGK